MQQPFAPLGQSRTAVAATMRGAYSGSGTDAFLARLSVAEANDANHMHMRSGSPPRFEPLRTPHRTTPDRRMMQQQARSTTQRPSSPPAPGWTLAPSQRNMHLLGRSAAQPSSEQSSRQAQRSYRHLLQAYTLDNVAPGRRPAGLILDAPHWSQARRLQESSIAFGDPTPSERDRYLRHLMD